MELAPPDDVLASDGGADLGTAAAVSAAAAAAEAAAAVVTLAPIWLPGVSTIELCSHSVHMLAWKT